MQTLLRNFPWSPALPVDKPYNPKGVVDLAQTKIKRKRISDSSASPRSLQPKKFRLDGGAVQAAAAEVVAPESFDLAGSALMQKMDGVTTVASHWNGSLGPKAAATVAVDAPAYKVVDIHLPLDETVVADVQFPVQAQAVPEPATLTKESSAAPPPASSVPVSVPVSKPEADVAVQSDANVVATMSFESMEDRLKSIILAQINQAILFKHNEMRLIDQEIAKCQVALEQIRRCEQIPFPGSQGPSQSVSQHKGPALVAPHGMTIPTHPAPWGVTDGPYSRHYAQWLIPSPTFDPQSVHFQATTMSPLSRDGRPTRGNTVDVPALNFYSARAARANAGRRSTVDPQSPKIDPLIIKRQQDGKMVKLYCTSCNPERSDFANVQGFLNHCRISHKQDFKSHEAAAIACGRVVDTTETEPSQPQTQSQTPVVATPREIPFQPVFPTPVTVKAQGVHPLNQKSANDKRPIDQIAPYIPSPPAVAAATASPANGNFVASSAAPHLSTQLQKGGFSGDFDELVKNAKRKVDLSVYDDTDAETVETPAKKSKKLPKAPKAKGTTRPGKSTVSVHKPETASSGMKPSPSVVVKDAPIGRSVPQPRQALRPGSSGSHGALSALPRISTDAVLPLTHEELSPNTADSNPGLVSDRDDDDVDNEDASSEQQQTDPDVMMVDIEDSDVERGHSSERSQRTCGN